MMDFMQSWTFMISMGLLLVALIGLLIFLQKRKNDDD